MLKKYKELKITPAQEIIGLLFNSRELALAQHITEARDVIRAARIVANSFSLSDDDLFDRLGEAVISKPYYALPAEFDNAFNVIAARWKKIAK